MRRLPPSSTSPAYRESTTFALTAGGADVAYEDLGAGPPLALLHGLSETRESWREAGYVARFLRSGRRVILIDARGHGASNKPHDPRDYAPSKRAQDVIAVLDDLAIARADLVGFSMGGGAALATALHFPKRVRRLVMISAHPFAQDMSPYRNAIADGADTWLAMLASLGATLSDAATRRIRANDFAALRACVALDRPDGSSALKALAPPLLAIAGADDPDAFAVRACAALADGSFLGLPGRNHLTSFLAIDDVEPAIETFLSRSAAADAAVALPLI